MKKNANSTRKWYRCKFFAICKSGLEESEKMQRIEFFDGYCSMCYYYRSFMKEETFEDRSSENVTDEISYELVELPLWTQNSKMSMESML